MSALSEVGCGVQVVFVEEDGTYRVDEEALRRVTSHEKARGLPVAVVSVAGATRGGKSFLLDFFLRYLRASDEARRNGAWIGADDDPLTGFSWRGGWERNTTGILLWSVPIVVTQQINGQKRKLAVLLMDTQGTFDNTSTVKDCTTIFAMSTLISSVQIYNLAQIIKEDDLQHLQLFTEYGKLARKDEGSKPFQSLIFRVRDWMFPYDHPYGATGGENYLRTVLTTETKKKEIKDLREHIRSSFETVSCILTPSPGKAVTDKNFNGRLCDLDPEFTDALRELVPLILDPQNLIPKVINGTEVMTRELPTYIRTYLDVFNSDELPTPVSILQATSLASLETALNAARAVYTEHMEKGCGGARSVVRAAVPLLHRAALRAARDAFTNRNTLASHALVTAKLQTLVEELDTMLNNYIAINRAKILKAIAESHAAFEGTIRATVGDKPVCLHPRHAAALLSEARRAAAALFDASRLRSGDGHDEDRDELLQWLDKKSEELASHNELNNQAARAHASGVYAERVRRAIAAGAVSAEQLEREHKSALKVAMKAFTSARCSNQYEGETDCYLEQLVENIREQHEEWEAANNKNCKSIRRTALFAYNNYMNGVWGPHRCLHPDALRREHDTARAAALAEFDNSGDVEDFVAMLESRYDELRETNNTANSSLVDTSYGEYCRRMDVKCAPSLTSILIVPWLIKVHLQLPKYHETAMREAREFFHSHRRAFGNEHVDDYLDTLNGKLSAGYAVYCDPLKALARELNVPLP